MGAAGAIVGMQGAGMLLGAYGQYQAGQANSAILRMNAAYARQQEAQALEAGEYQAGVRDLKETQLAGEQASSFATQGVVAGAGTAGSVVTAGEAMSQADEAMIRVNARRQAFGLESQALSDEFQAKMAKQGAGWGAATSVVSGAGQMGMTYAMLGGGGGGGGAPNDAGNGVSTPETF